MADKIRVKKMSEPHSIGARGQGDELGNQKLKNLPEAEPSGAETT
jgi:hypothetical protein